jgi:hypothetical protein
VRHGTAGRVRHGTVLTTGSWMVRLLGMCRKGKRQRYQWKQNPRSAGSVHSCKPLFATAW